MTDPDDTGTASPGSDTPPAGGTQIMGLFATLDGQVGQGTSPYPVEQNAAIVAAAEAATRTPDTDSADQSEAPQ